ncbi:MAG: hypothetical protein KAT05_17310 [Spirochaetes bacterium]|nr:hypothetical protein [Spirochaetota bacterium]
MEKEILSNEELKAIYDKAIGFVYNDYKKSYGEEMNKLHSAKCRCLNPDNPNRLKVKDKNGRKLPKFYFDTREDANTWLEEKRSSVGYSDCRLCMV